MSSKPRSIDDQVLIRMSYLPLHDHRYTSCNIQSNDMIDKPELVKSQLAIDGNWLDGWWNNILERQRNARQKAPKDSLPRHKVPWLGRPLPNQYNWRTSSAWMTTWDGFSIAIDVASFMAEVAHEEPQEWYALNILNSGCSRLSSWLKSSFGWRKLWSFISWLGLGKEIDHIQWS